MQGQTFVSEPKKVWSAYFPPAGICWEPGWTRYRTLPPCHCPVFESCSSIQSCIVDFFFLCPLVFAHVHMLCLSLQPMHCTRLPEVSNESVCARLAPAQLAIRRANASNINKASTQDKFTVTEDELDDSTEDCSSEYGQVCGSVRVYKCARGACDTNNSCAQKRIGPLCGMCSSNYAMVRALTFSIYT